MRSISFGLAFALVLSRAHDASACYVEYTLKEKDTLQSIARQIYNDPAKWQIIYYANQDRLGQHSSLLRPGTSIRLPCTGGDTLVKQENSATGSLDRKEPQEISVPFHMTSTDGVGRKIGVIHARNVRITVGARQETALMIRTDLEGLTPGPHAFHIHSNANCGPGQEGGKIVPGLAAGPHLFLKGTGEESGITYMSHLGNLPNLLVASDGTAKREIVVPRLTVEDIRGRPLIVHVSQDDASDRQACGIVP